MLKYPLYEELAKRAALKPDNNIDTSCLCQTINAISLNNENYIEHYEELEAIILYYELSKNSNILLTTTPFDVVASRW